MRPIFHFFLVIVLALIYTQIPLIHYGIQQGVGQMSIIWNAQPIQEFIQQPNTPDSLIVKLEFIEEVRNYATDSLGLQNSDNYTTIYDQKGQPVLWVVTGSQPFQLEPYQWEFPVLGTVPYKGFFNSDMAKVELEKLQAEGYDAGVRTVGGWSTLGWFSDPILSNMLGRSYGDLANLIIHELVHATIFVKDSIEFNENLASFIADQGAVKFMAYKFGENGKETISYLRETRDDELYTRHILNGANKLKLLYDSLDTESNEEKKKLKQKLIQKIMRSTDTLNLFDKSFIKLVRNELPNNTYFLSYMRYSSKQNELEELYLSKYNNDLKDFILYLKNKHPYL